MSLATFIAGFVPGRTAKLRRDLKISQRRFRAMAADQSRREARGSASMSGREDAQNIDYLTNLGDVLQRSQNLDANNPDVGGFHRTRVAQIIGGGVNFQFVPKDSEVKSTVEIRNKVDRIREIHSREGGFDASGSRRSEQKQQERALLTMFINGCCLIHRVWRNDDSAILPLRLEMIPGSRITTPYDKLGDPRVSYGVQYSDDHRTRVTGYYVRRVSKTIGNSFVPDYVWDLLPVEDCSLLSLTEMAGIDRALPLSHRVQRMLHNRGEFIEAAVRAARAQTKHYGVNECARGRAVDAAGDDTDFTVNDQNGSMGFTEIGDSVQMLYTAAGEKVTWSSAKLPEPDFKGFMDVTDARSARGFVSSVSTFTRQVNNSYAGGRLEKQQDDPIIDQYRDAFVSAWHKVNEWFLEAIWLSGAVDLPGYSNKTASYWCEFNAEWPGEVHINPVDTVKARELGYMLRTTTPQQGCEEEGTTLRRNLTRWAEAIKMQHEIEDAHGLPRDSIPFLLSGKAISTQAGADIEPPTPETEAAPPDEDQDPAPKPQPAKKTNGHNGAGRLAGVN